jgi:hypothetical protein
MLDDNQSHIPPSFVALFVPPGQHKPIQPWRTVLARYEWCEDLAQLTTETAGQMQFSLGIGESDVLHRCLLGLSTPASTTEPAAVSDAEAVWVIRRLAELMDWTAVLPRLDLNAWLAQRPAAP